MRQKLINLWSNPYIQGGFFLTFFSFFTNLLNYIFTFLAGRLLGPSGYGEITSLFSYIALLSLPISIITTYLINKISSKTEKQSYYFVYLEKKFIFLLHRFRYVFIAVFFIIPFIPSFTNLSPVVGYSLIPFLMINLVSSFYHAAFQALKMFFIFGLITFVTVVLKLFSILPSFIISQPLSIIIILQLISALFILIVSIIIIRHKLFYSKIYDKQQFNKFSLLSLVKSQYFTLTLFSILSITMLSNLDIIFVKKYFSSYQSGLYNSWNLLAKIILYVLGPLTQISFVFFSDTSQKHHQEKVVKMSLILLGVIGIISWIFYSYAGNFLIHILFGSRFDSIVPYLGLAAIFGVGYSAITFFNSYFLAKKSKVSLLLVTLLPFYIIAFFLLPKSLLSIMYINIVFCAILTILYSFFFFTHKSSST